MMIKALMRKSFMGADEVILWEDKDYEITDGLKWIEVTSTAKDTYEEYLLTTIRAYPKKYFYIKLISPEEIADLEVKRRRVEICRLLIK